MSPLLHNFPLIAALLSIILAQAVKVPIHLFTRGVWDMRLAFSTGGMPSSHSAAVASLSTAIAFENGMGSSIFAAAVIFSAITMFDAAGVRRHAGTHAMLLNRIIKESRKNHEGEPIEALKELLGHKPIEVFAGALFGIVVSLVMHELFYLNS